MAEKQCRRCKNIKNYDDFPVSRSYWYSHKFVCFSCLKASYERNDLRERRKSLWENYRLSLADYSLLFESQHGGCAICNTPPTLKRLAVDHDHTTGYLRGLLCSRCNLGIGRFEDNTTLFRNAILYLEQGTDRIEVLLPGFNIQFNAT